MQTIHISRNSWHYKFLKLTYNYPDKIYDLCTYIRCLVLTASAMTVFCGLILSGVFFGFVVLCFYVSLSISWATTIWAILLVMFLYARYLVKLFSDESDYIRKWRRRHRPDGSLKTHVEIQRQYYGDPYEAPSFWSSAWDSIRNKVCFRLEVK